MPVAAQLRTPCAVSGTSRPIAREFKTESISICPYVGPNGELRINEKRAFNVSGRIYPLPEITPIRLILLFAYTPCILRKALVRAVKEGRCRSVFWKNT